MKLTTENTPETDDQPCIMALNDNGYQVPCVDIEYARRLERERDEARELNAKLIALAERATDDLGWFYESHADGISLELEKLKEAAK